MTRRNNTTNVRTITFETPRLRTPCPPTARLAPTRDGDGLGRALANVVSAMPLVSRVTTAPEVEAIADGHGLDALGASVLCVEARRSGRAGPAARRAGGMVVVAVPDAVGRDGSDRLADFARAVRAAGWRVRFVKASTVARQPRLANARLLGAHAIRRVAPDLAERLKEAVRAGGARRAPVDAGRLQSQGVPSTTIGDCARAIDCTDRVGAILALASSGEIRIDMRRPITLLSRVALHRTDIGQEASLEDRGAEAHDRADGRRATCH